MSIGTPETSEIGAGALTSMVCQQWTQSDSWVNDRQSARAGGGGSFAFQKELEIDCWLGSWRCEMLVPVVYFWTAFFAL